MDTKWTCSEGERGCPFRTPRCPVHAEEHQPSPDHNRCRELMQSRHDKPIRKRSL